MSSIHTILHNEKYIGTWVWNKTKVVKNPDTGRRMRRIDRPRSGSRRIGPSWGSWTPSSGTRSRPGSRRWPTGLANAPAGDRAGGGACRLLAAPAGGAAAVWRLRRPCMHAVTFTRKKGTTVYTYRWYVCGFAKDKGRRSASTGYGIGPTWLEGAIIARFREAMTPAMLQAVVGHHQRHPDDERAGRRSPGRSTSRRTCSGSNEKPRIWSGFCATGSDSPTVRAELEATETALQGLREDRLRLQGLESGNPSRRCNCRGSRPSSSTWTICCGRTQSEPSWSS